MKNNSSICASEKNKGLEALVAGEGFLPVLIAEHASRSGRALMVYTLGSTSVYDSFEGVEAISLGALPSTSAGSAIAQAPERDAGSEFPPFALDLRATVGDMLRRGVVSVTLAGVVPKSAMYGASLDPTLRALLKRGGNDDHSLLGRIVAVFESAGLPVVPYTSLLAEGIAPEGFVAGREPTEAEAADVEYGRKILSITLPLSFGQSVVLAGGAVVAVEAMEGTDAMIRRAGEILSGSDVSFDGGGVAVKMMRPDQDERYDVPVVGVSTLETMRAARLTCLAVEAGRTLLIEPEKFRERASQLNIAVCGISSGARPLSGGTRP